MVGTVETELGLLSLNHLKKLAQQQPYSNSNPTCFYWMWNPNKTSQEHDERSWEVRAFEEDTNHALGTTWPPRSYTCTFCRREFQSAQALGGHMNVHRRDRAKLHQMPPPPITAIPSPKLLANGGELHFLYNSAQFDKHFPNFLGTSGVFTSIKVNDAAMGSPSTLLSMSPSIAASNFPVALPSISNRSEAASPSLSTVKDEDKNYKDSSVEELDLELRLGWISSSQP